MAEQVDPVGVHRVELLQRAQRFDVSIELDVEVDITERAALTVAATRPLDPQRDVSMPGEVLGDTHETGRLTDRLVDGKTGVTSLEQ